MTTTTIQKKLEKAREELLDLGLRNPLLNYRTLKARGLEIAREKPEHIYKILVTDKKRMSFLGVAERPNSLEQIMVPTDKGSLTQDSVVSQESYVDLKVQTNYTDKQLEHRLLNTYHLAKTYVEEQGVNILYLALGMLHWYEADSSQEPKKAPLILVPIQLERVSAKERFTVSYTDDEIGHNISLVAKVKADFGLEIPGLPDLDEVNFTDYMDSVEKSLEAQRRWTIDRNSIVIGFFSFGKFLMYRDLDINNWPEHSRPEEHPVITALLEDGFRETASNIGENDHVDQHLELKDAHHIMDADSSQIIAILDANQGRNMVIQGPPGTGKSQTITNLIAEAIAAGKKVLFVSEKMAALEVVKRRLDSVGLGVACLELHSHKTNKKSLLNNLASTLDLGRPKNLNDGNVDLLAQTQNRLNEYSVAMNSEVSPTGVTPYQAIGKLVADQVKFKNITFQQVTIDAIGSWTPARFTKKEALIDELQNVLKSLGIPTKHPFWGSQKKVLLPHETDSISRSSMDTLQSMMKLTEKLSEFTLEMKFPPAKDKQSAQTFIDALQKGIVSPDLRGVQIESTLWLEKQAELEKWALAGQDFSKLREKYDELFIAEAWDQDLWMTRKSIATYQDKWWRFLSGDYRKAKNLMAALFKNPKDITIRLLDDVDAIMESRRLKEEIDNNGATASELFPSVWKGAYSEWDHIAALVKWIPTLLTDIKNGVLPDEMLNFLATAPDKMRLAAVVTDTESLLAAVHKSVNILENQLEWDNERRFGSREGLMAQPFDSIVQIVRAWQERITELHEMTSYNQLSHICAEEELQPYVRLSREWEQAAELLTSCYRWNWYSSIISTAFKERPALTSFDGNRHNHAVQKFQELDRDYKEFNRLKIALDHWNRLPHHEAGGQLGVLRREFEKKTRHLPIRQLMSKAGNAIQAIKPVFMMGPLSISAYLEPGSLAFDLVVFDEASQVKPVDAFGAIIRAKQAIVVGDSKQMPPSNLFDSIAKEDDEDEDNFVADMESILGLFVGQNAPQRMLRWHYRSRHESLITVSNHLFYDNKLVIFPSPDSQKGHSGLKYTQLPDSHYDRGRTRTNKLEAKAVAQAIVEHARTRPHLTLGVAAFSMVQMQAIIDELEVVRRSDSSCEAFFSTHFYEPFFVKNLENVQGDERDVIFISIGYGKTAEGYLAMDFGLLNREGGERRLNVLITRARVRCEVFTNLSSDDIDLNRSEARGVKALKTFLKYAESGSLDVPVVTGKDFDSPFEVAVCASLQELGYEVKQQIGSAGFYVDLAVTDPEMPGRFLLGIECDGATYHSARSARDRDRLRQEVLEGLGWTIHRIWSTDWFKQPERELKKVVEAIERAKLLSKSQPAQKDSKDVQGIQREESPEKHQETSVIPYQTAQLTINLGVKELYAFPLSLVASWVSQIVRVESPIHVSEVMKRICEAAGIKRVGSRIQETIEKSFVILSDVSRRGDFLWFKDMEIPVLRDRSDAKLNKKVQLIAPEEIAVAIVKAVKDSYGVSVDNVAGAAFQTLGFARVTDDMKELIKPIISDLVLRGVLIDKSTVLVMS
jgi:very-short-patch-repair endonuclease